MREEGVSTLQQRSAYRDKGKIKTKGPSSYNNTSQNPERVKGGGRRWPGQHQTLLRQDSKETEQQLAKPTRKDGAKRGKKKSRGAFNLISQRA